MGNSCSFREQGDWDPHPEVTNAYDFEKDQGAATDDMNAPLSNYFVSSGHNSYLGGDQLIGAATTSTIIMCLKSGCRVIELDCYDGKGKQGPICKHGGTATKPITFRKCVEACRDHGFTASPYPVILTLENHTDEENQGYMAQILKDVFGTTLHVPSSAEPESQWQSPEALRGRFVIRGNASKLQNADLKSLIYISNTKFLGFSAMSALPNVTSSSIVESKVNMFMKVQGEDFGTMEGSRKEVKKNKKKQEKKQKVEAAVKAVAIGKPGGVEAEADPGEEVAEGAERELVTHKMIMQYTRNHLLRVYPAGWRVGSGNYDPARAWSMGTCFAALNWQTWDKPLWYNQAKFRDNDGCGYVKKPEFMLSGGDVPIVEPRTLRVHVYSGHKHQGLSCLCLKDDLMVKMEVRGMHMDCQKQSTPSVQDTGRLHVDKAYDFPIHFPEMAQLLVCLMDEDYDTNDVLGYFSVSLSSLKPGKYKLQMFDPNSPGGTTVIPGAWVKCEFSWIDAQPNPLGDGH